VSDTSPTPARYIHGSTDAREIARLETQARFVAPWSRAQFDALPGMRVLDLGTGIGAMARELAERFPGIELLGLDRSEAQLAVARARHPVATYVHGDATAMPFEDRSFDRVHASWLLEHVPEPVLVLREVHRVLRPGGIAHFVEVDNATLRTDPPLARRV
jgi:ubiquinone/menaquinone biosynthesis C-methylase UbiE